MFAAATAMLVTLVAVGMTVRPIDGGHGDGDDDDGDADDDDDDDDDDGDGDDGGDDGDDEGSASKAIVLEMPMSI